MTLDGVLKIVYKITSVTDQNDQNWIYLLFTLHLLPNALLLNTLLVDPILTLFCFCATEFQVIYFL
jgi:hypothetical protein